MNADEKDLKAVLGAALAAVDVAAEELGVSRVDVLRGLVIVAERREAAADMKIDMEDGE